jgi:hypothetical protein
MVQAGDLVTGWAVLAWADAVGVLMLNTDEDGRLAENPCWTFFFSEKGAEL